MEKKIKRMQTFVGILMIFVCLCIIGILFMVELISIEEENAKYPDYYIREEVQV